MGQVLNQLNKLSFVIAPVFYRLLFISVTGALAGGVILLIRKFFDKKIPPLWKYIMWAVVVLALLLPIRLESKVTLTENISVIEDISFREEYDNIRYEEFLYNQNQNMDGAKSQELQRERNILFYKSLVFDVIIPLAWFFGMCFAAAFFIGNKIVLSCRIKAGGRETHAFQPILAQCKEQLNIRGNVSVVLQSYIPSPALEGLLRPKILLPLYAENMSRESLYYVLLHELSHHKRKDMLVNYILLAVQAIHWFNPLVWFLFQLIREDMELLNDSYVLQIIGEEQGRSYAKSLVEVLGLSHNVSLMPKLLCMVDGKKSVERRISMMKLGETFQKHKLLAAVCCLGVICLAGGLFLTQKNSTKEYESLSYSEYIAAVSEEKGLTEGQLNRLEAMGLSRGDIQQMGREELIQRLKEGGEGPSGSADFEIRDHSGKDITDIITNLWWDANNIYNVDSSNGIDLGEEEDLLGNGLLFYEFKNYEEYATRVFSANGLKQLENAKIGSDTITFLQKRDGKTYRLGPWKTGYCYEDALHAMEAKSVEENRIVAAVEYETPASAAERDSAGYAPQYGSVDFTIIKVNGRWLVEDYRFPENRDAKAEGWTGPYRINSNLPRGDIQLTIQNTTEFPCFGDENEGFAYYESTAHQLHFEITTSIGQPDATPENPVGSLAGAGVAFDYNGAELRNVEFKTGAENKQLEITEEELKNIAQAFMEKITGPSIQSSLGKITLENFPHSTQRTIDYFKEYINEIGPDVAMFILGDDQLVYSMLMEAYWQAGEEEYEFAQELVTGRGEELTRLVSQRVESYRDGSFAPVPNHHPAYPEDFPAAEDLPAIRALSDYIIVWRNTQTEGSTERPGAVSVLVPIDEAHAILLEPNQFGDEEGNITLGFGNTQYLNAPEWGFPTFFEWLSSEEGYSMDGIQWSAELKSRYGASAGGLFFPAYALENPQDLPIIDMVNSTERFRVAGNFPAGWEFRTSNNGEKNIPGGEFYTPVYIYENDRLIGYIGFQPFEPYEGEIGPEQYYQAVYANLRLSRFFRWDPYTPVVREENFETGIAEIYYLDEGEAEKNPGALANVPEQESRGILSYDKEKGVYIGIAFMPDTVEGQQVESIARSIRILDGE